ncbi:TRAP transporter small permease [Desulfoluna spongiiphila]|uniref:TRAP-type C4-dicarboxylate transport system, small permease component n=1 Tax=Desulfoluna spongiiphila TaxID=419481 RepID=A0A1G5HT91_9BACT|nr:TRAP transporter small permease [Desulfoluna spongiiphila]SCY66669.1 TRAP-type C4-dicarboxylate transport system, small permease component [Desulfoluna spongiiphila]VVS91859.1 trap transporter small membrane protein dctq [Desulfoluna spongiiphila]
MTALCNKIDRVVTSFEEWTLFLTVMAALTALFASVVLRYGFNHSLAWSEELVRLVIVYTTFVGCSRAVKNGAMVRIDALVQFFPRLKGPLLLFSYGAILLFSGILIVFGISMVMLQMRTGQKTIIMQIPMAWLYGILPLSGGLMGFRALVQAAGLLGKTGDEGGGQSHGK